MIDGAYKLKIDVPLSNGGSVVLRTEGDATYADIDAPVIGKQHVKGRCEGNTFTAEGSKSVFLVGRIDYTLRAEVSGDNMRVYIQSNKGDFTFDGVRVK